MTLPVSYPKRSREGIARHARKKHVRRHGDHAAPPKPQKRGRR